MRSQPMEATMLSHWGKSLESSSPARSLPARVSKKRYRSPPAAWSTVGGTRERMVVDPAA